LTNLIIIGGGEHSNVIISTITDKYKILGYVDNKESFCQCKYIGKDEKIMQILQLDPNVKLIFGIGNLLLRKQIVEKYHLEIGLFTSIIHSSAIVSKPAQVALGSFIGAGVILQPNSKIGIHSIINSGVIVEHDCEIADYTHIAPGAVLGGGCIIGENSFIGLGSRVNDHLNIGNNVIIGSGSVVINNIDDNIKVAGIPAKQI